jgi:3-deoxy-manno-octulosonate cytidylyltransferase (CMP-KDO synthetase)
MSVIGLIPSRLASSRLPGKALALIEDIPIIVHVAKRAQLSRSLDRVIVCTDSHEIAEVCTRYSIPSILTNSVFLNGTERIASVASDLECDYVIDIQGDEPLLNPHHIDQVVNELLGNDSTPDIVIPTLKVPYSSPETIVRVQSSISRRVMTLTRSSLPHRFAHTTSFIEKHLSIIGFTRDALHRYSLLPPSSFETIESVELLRAIENDFNVISLPLSGDSFSVDIEDDLLKARIAMKSDTFIAFYS